MDGCQAGPAGGGTGGWPRHGALQRALPVVARRPPCLSGWSWAAPAALALPNAAFPGPRHGARHVHSVRKVILLIVSCPPALSAALHLFSRLSFPTSLQAQPSPLYVRGTPNNSPGRYGLSSLERTSPASRTPASLVVAVRPPAGREYNGRHREARGAQQGTYTSNALLLL